MSSLTVDRAISRIRAYAAVRGWRKSRLAAEAGLPDTTLRHFGRPDWNPTLSVLRRLEAVIPSDFMDESAPAEPERLAG